MHDVIQRHAPGARSVLDLGCGTGRHAGFLAQKGYEVVGVDNSAEMLESANGARDGTFGGVRERLTFERHDARSARLDRQFDAVVSLFHVMSYQTSNADVAALLATARAHVGESGVVIFDCWYGPGVLSDPPRPRLKRLQDGSRSLLRFAEPELSTNENVVLVHYLYLQLDPATGRYAEFSETHAMRYFFQPELHQFLDGAGLAPLALLEWMKAEPPGAEAWNAMLVARRGLDPLLSKN